MTVNIFSTAGIRRKGDGGGGRTRIDTCRTGAKRQRDTTDTYIKRRRVPKRTAERHGRGSPGMPGRPIGFRGLAQSPIPR